MANPKGWLPLNAWLSTQSLMSPVYYKHTAAEVRSSP